jgi:hypothetical protein
MMRFRRSIHFTSGLSSIYFCSKRRTGMNFRQGILISIISLLLAIFLAGTGCTTAEVGSFVGSVVGGAVGGVAGDSETGEAVGAALGEAAGAKAAQEKQRIEYEKYILSQLPKEWVDPKGKLILKDGVYAYLYPGDYYLYWDAKQKKWVE